MSKTILPSVKFCAHLVNFWAKKNHFFTNDRFVYRQYASKTNERRWNGTGEKTIDEDRKLWRWIKNKTFCILFTSNAEIIRSQMSCVQTMTAKWTVCIFCNKTFLLLPIYYECTRKIKTLRTTNSCSVWCSNQDKCKMKNRRGKGNSLSKCRIGVCGSAAMILHRFF